MNLLGNRDSPNKRQASGQNGNCNRFLHRFPLNVVDLISTLNESSADYKLPAKMKQVQ
jgi:hypothetical protein